MNSENDSQFEQRFFHWNGCQNDSNHFYNVEGRLAPERAQRFDGIPEAMKTNMIINVKKRLTGTRLGNELL